MVHHLIIRCTVFAKLGVEQGVHAVLQVAQHVVDLLIELEVVKLEATDFGMEFGDHLELFVELLHGGE